MARNYDNTSFLEHYLSPPPFDICFFIFILIATLGLSWYMTAHVKLFYMLSPVILLVLVQCMSSRGTPLFMLLPQRNSLPRAGGSPWGVALLLVFLLYMVSKQSSFHERWFPVKT